MNSEFKNHPSLCTDRLRKTTKFERGSFLRPRLPLTATLCEIVPLHSVLCVLARTSLHLGLNSHKHWPARVGTQTSQDEQSRTKAEEPTNERTIIIISFLSSIFLSDAAHMPAAIQWRHVRYINSKSVI